MWAYLRGETTQAENAPSLILVAQINAAVDVRQPVPVGLSKTEDPETEGKLGQPLFFVSDGGNGSALVWQGL